jgi:hypothetical protein
MTISILSLFVLYSTVRAAGSTKKAVADSRFGSKGVSNKQVLVWLKPEGRCNISRPLISDRLSRSVHSNPDAGGLQAGKN